MNTVAMDKATPPTGSPRVDPEVAAYVGLVRTALRDLAPEDLEDLTGGLEADLAELAAESEEPLISRLGEPSSYAAELRSAAGFPPAVPVVDAKEPWLRRTRAQWRGRWEDWRAAYPWLEQVRPIWWVIRGAVLAYLLLMVLGVHRINLLGLVAGAALSFWVGLLQDGWRGWRSRLVFVANVAAGLLVLPALFAVAEPSRVIYSDNLVEVAPRSGVWINGEQPTNFYVYDGHGQRVDGARIFDQSGTALTVHPWDVYDGYGPEPTAYSVTAFPTEYGSVAGWDGDSNHAGWVPPILIGPAPGFLAPDAVTPGGSEATGAPTETPTQAPTDAATDAPTGAATGAATPEPTPMPSPEPTASP